MNETPYGDTLAAVERAMIDIRRRQRRRTLMRRSGEPALGPAFDVLDVLEAAGRPVGVKEVAEALDVDQPRASKLVAAAVADGCVRREADQRDGRRTPLVLTERGEELLARAHETRRTALAAAMAGWTDGERDTFATLLSRFTAGLG